MLSFAKVCGQQGFRERSPNMHVSGSIFLTTVILHFILQYQNIFLLVDLLEDALVKVVFLLNMLAL